MKPTFSSAQLLIQSIFQRTALSIIHTATPECEGLLLRTEWCHLSSVSYHVHAKNTIKQSIRGGFSQLCFVWYHLHFTSGTQSVPSGSPSKRLHLHPWDSYRLLTYHWLFSRLNKLSLISEKKAKAPWGLQRDQGEGLHRPSQAQLMS